MKLLVSLLVAGALLVPGSTLAQVPPTIQAKKGAASQSAPVVVPLCVGTSFNASLESALDSQRSKAGDPVTAVVTETVRYEGSVVFPKGTKLVGRVVRTSSRAKSDDGSGLFVQFDNAVLKNGQSVTLNAGIQALLAGPEAASVKESPEATADGVAPVEPAALEQDDGSASVKSATYSAPVPSVRSQLLPIAEGGVTADGQLTPESKGALGNPDLNVYTPTSAGSHGTVLLSAASRVHLDAGTHILVVIQPPPSTDDNQSQE